MLQDTIKASYFILLFVGIFSGALSAVYWFKAGRETYSPPSFDDEMAQSVPGGFNSREEWKHFMDMINLKQWIVVSGQYNKRGSLWAMVAVASSALAQLLGLFTRSN